MSKWHRHRGGKPCEQCGQVIAHTHGHKPKARAACPLCGADVSLTSPADRLHAHDPGFPGRARYRMTPCPGSGHTIGEASLLATRKRVETPVETDPDSAA